MSDLKDKKKDIRSVYNSEKWRKKMSLEEDGEYRFSSDSFLDAMKFSVIVSISLSRNTLKTEDQRILSQHSNGEKNYCSHSATVIDA